ncbi:MarR family winged helix-turn-helix transcriptional regulator [Cohnella faecalis]|uniref:MarR family transcriptional regulator n=1 Tax=Cohnella faecalis TaxID=2315694 RepID=A0A398CSG9_9BACL|nr:MarR family transcriptional regulator [Cohnella faecalis]RIE03688.1 MarR family transcriptional regulator [Cohnella faecalis]
MNRNELLLSYVEKSLMHKRIFETEWYRHNTMDLSSTQTAALSIIAKKGPLQAKELGLQLSLSSGGITTVCDKLLSRGLIRRLRSDGEDRRAVFLETTEEGRAMVIRTDAVWEQVLNVIFSVLTDAEIAMLHQIYSKLVDPRT